MINRGLKEAGGKLKSVVEMYVMDGAAVCLSVGIFYDALFCGFVKSDTEVSVCACNSFPFSTDISQHTIRQKAKMVVFKS